MRKPRHSKVMKLLAKNPNASNEQGDTEYEPRQSGSWVSGFPWGILLYQRQKRDLKVDSTFSAVKGTLFKISE